MVATGCSRQFSAPMNDSHLQASRFSQHTDRFMSEGAASSQFEVLRFVPRVETRRSNFGGTR